METRNNKEKVFKIICVLMVSLIVVVFFGGFTSNAIDVGDNLEQETKIICSATIDEEFDDKSFLVVLNKEVSRQL